jgi:Ankyrin repeats (3 copies)/Ankyrin repeat
MMSAIATRLQCIVAQRDKQTLTFRRYFHSEHGVAGVTSLSCSTHSLDPLTLSEHDRSFGSIEVYADARTARYVEAICGKPQGGHLSYSHMALPLLRNSNSYSSGRRPVDCAACPPPNVPICRRLGESSLANKSLHTTQAGRSRSSSAGVGLKVERSAGRRTWQWHGMSGPCPSDASVLAGALPPALAPAVAEPQASNAHVWQAALERGEGCGSLAGAAALLWSGAKLWGWCTPLAAAAAVGRVEAVRALLACGAPVDECEAPACCLSAPHRCSVHNRHAARFLTDTNRLGMLQAYRVTSPRACCPVGQRACYNIAQLLREVLLVSKHRLVVWQELLLKPACLRRRCCPPPEGKSCKDTSSWTPLMCAARFNHGAVTSVLLSAGANLRGCHESRPSWTALTIAAAARAPDAVEALLASDFGGPCRSNSSAMRLAARHTPPDFCACTKRSSCVLCRQRQSAGEAECHAVVAALQHGGVDVNAGCRHGSTPLQLAVCKGDAGMARALLAHGARLRGAAPRGDLLERAVKQCAGDHAMLRLLLKQMHTGACSSGELARALSAAIMRGCGGCVTWLYLSGGPDAQQWVTDPVMTPIMQAAGLGNRGVPALQALLAAGAPAEPCAPQCWPSAVWLAVAARSVRGLELLVAHGANASVRAPGNGCTALMLAAALGAAHMCAVLADVAPAALDARCDAGRTAVDWAARHGRWRVVCLLLSRSEKLRESASPEVPRAVSLSQGSLRALRNLTARSFSQQQQQSLSTPQPRKGRQSRVSLDVIVARASGSAPPPQKVRSGPAKRRRNRFVTFSAFETTLQPDNALEQLGPARVQPATACSTATLAKDAAAPCMAQLSTSIARATAESRGRTTESAPGLQVSPPTTSSAELPGACSAGLQRGAPVTDVPAGEQNEVPWAWWRCSPPHCRSGSSSSSSQRVRSDLFPECAQGTRSKGGYIALLLCLCGTPQEMRAQQDL